MTSVARSSWLWNEEHKNVEQAQVTLTVEQDLNEGELVLVRAQGNQSLPDLNCLVHFSSALSSCSVAPITAAGSHVVGDSFNKFKHYNKLNIISIL